MAPLGHTIDSDEVSCATFGGGRRRNRVLALRLRLEIEGPLVCSPGSRAAPSTGRGRGKRVPPEGGVIRPPARQLSNHANHPGRMRPQPRPRTHYDDRVGIGSALGAFPECRSHSRSPTPATEERAFGLNGRTTERRRSAFIAQRCGNGSRAGSLSRGMPGMLPSRAHSGLWSRVLHAHQVQEGKGGETVDASSRP